MSLAEMPQDHKFSDDEVAWLKAHNRIDDLRENKRKFPDPPKEHASRPAHKAAAPKPRPTSE